VAHQTNDWPSSDGTLHIENCVDREKLMELKHQITS